MSSGARAAHPGGSIWDRSHLPLTTGSILAYTVIAVLGLAMATVAPVVADDLGGRNRYGWIFAAFILPQIVGTIYAGREIDRHSAARVFAINLILLTAGCVVAGAAPTFEWLLVARAIQGFGAGGISSSVYTVISRAYEDHLRPGIMAATSAAWVVPSLIGPAIVGYVAETWTWRWVFLGLLPILLATAPLTLPAFREVRPAEPAAGGGRRLQLGVALAVATGFFLAGLEVRPWGLGLFLAAIGVAGIAPTLTRLMPEGTFRLRPVMPAAIVSRALGFGGFAVVETYLIFVLKDIGGYSAASIGLLLTCVSLAWVTGSWIQARWDRATGAAQRGRRLTIGWSIVLVMNVAIFGTVALTGSIGLVAALVAWTVTGIGIGLSFPTAVTLAFSDMPAGTEGAVSSSMLLLDLFAFASGVGLGGVLLAVVESSGGSTSTGASLALGLGTAMGAIAVVAAVRTWQGGSLAAG